MVAALLPLLLTACAAVDPAGGAQAQLRYPPPAAAKVTRRMTVAMTEYHMILASSVPREAPGATLILDMGDRKLGSPVRLQDWCRGADNGALEVTEPGGQRSVFAYAGTRAHSGVTADGERYTPPDCTAFFGTAPGYNVPAINQSRFKPSSGPFGEAAGGLVLVPYRTLAAHKDAIPPHTVVFIPEARGVPITLPSGERAVHDGYFLTADHGGAVNGAHIDVFIGRAQRSPFPSDGVNTQVEVFLVDDPDIRAGLLELHAPPRR